MKLYLDNCCFNRFFDDQSQLRIRFDAFVKKLFLITEPSEDTEKNMKFKLVISVLSASSVVISDFLRWCQRWQNTVNGIAKKQLLAMSLQRKNMELIGTSLWKAYAPANLNDEARSQRALMGSHSSFGFELFGACHYPAERPSNGEGG